jgi:hypothetical protein
MNAASESAKSQFVSSGTALARCLLLKSVKIRRAGCVGTLIGDSTFILIRSIAK